MNMWQIMKSASGINAKMHFFEGPFSYNEAVKRCYNLNRAEKSELISYHVRLYMPIREDEN